MNALSHGFTPKMKPISPKRSAVVAALDVGTSKIVCLIARLVPHPPQEVLQRRSHAVEVLGIGHVRSEGIKAGSVVDIDAAENAIRYAVDTAERMAKVRIESVLLSMTAGRISSELYAATVPLQDGRASDSDIERVLAAGSRHSARDDRVVLHSLPIGYTIDDTHCVRDPRGMIGSQLGVDMHFVTADAAPARNLMFAVEHCHLNVEAMAAAPYAGGLCVLADDESDLGAVVVDMGAGTTTMAVFSGGHLVHTDGFALGGNHITMDLARGLSTALSEAERIKTLYGSAIEGPSDERDVVALSPVGDEGDAPQIVPRALLTRIVKPRVEEILEMVRDRLGASHFAADKQARVVLTGGACQLTGMADVAAQILGRQVRLGRPLGVSGLPEPAKAPAFAAVTGLLIYPQAAHLEQFEPRLTRQLMTGTDGYLAKVGRWLRESF